MSGIVTYSSKKGIVMTSVSDRLMKGLVIVTCVREAFV